MLKGKKALAKILNWISGIIVVLNTTYLTVTSNTVSITAAASKYTGATSSTIKKSGYYPLGIVGFDVSGTGSGSTPLTKIYLSTQSTGTAAFLAGVRNVTSTQYTVTVTAKILWVKVNN